MIFRICKIKRKNILFMQFKILFIKKLSKPYLIIKRTGIKHQLFLISIKFNKLKSINMMSFSSINQQATMQPTIDYENNALLHMP